MSAGRAVEILLVEDNPNDVELALRALKAARISNRVVVVNDGAEALAFLFNTGKYAHPVDSPRPRLVLLDLKLPKADGLEVLAKVKGDPRTRAIPVVMLTTSHEESDIVESYRLGVNSYIVKPVDFEQFVKAVQQLELYWLLLNETPGNRD